MMCDLSPIQPQFPLWKHPCSYELDSTVQPCSPLHALYYPESHPDLFASEISVCDWLSAVFGAVSGDMPFLCSFADNCFVVCNLTTKASISLDYLDISSSLFNPWLLLGTFIPFEYAGSHPIWFYFHKSHYLSLLNQFCYADLQAFVKMLHLQVTCNLHTK
jgi:hypothetical protein